MCEYAHMSAGLCSCFTSTVRQPEGGDGDGGGGGGGWGVSLW